MEVIVKKQSASPSNSNIGLLKPVFVKEGDKWIEANPSVFPNNGMIFVVDGYESISENYRHNELFYVDCEINTQGFVSTKSDSSRWLTKASRASSPGDNDFCRIIPHSKPFSPDREVRIWQKDAPLNDIFIRHESSLYGPFGWQREESDDVGVYLLNAQRSHNHCIYQIKASVAEKGYHIHQEGSFQYVKSVNSLISDPGVNSDLIYFGPIEELIDWAKSRMEAVTSQQLNGVKSLFKSLRVSKGVEQAMLDRIQSLFYNSEAWFSKRLPQFIQQYLRTDDGKKALQEYFDTNAGALQAKSEKNLELEQIRKELEALKQKQFETVQDERFTSLSDLDKQLINRLLESEEERLKLNELESVTKEYNRLELEVKIAERDVEKLNNKIQENITREKELASSLSQFKAEFSNSDTVRTNLLKAKPYVDLINGIIPTTVSQSDSEAEVLPTSALKVKAHVEPVHKYIETIQQTLEAGGRKIDFNELANYLITVQQNFLTVFAGLPGVGKTSLVTKLAAAAGLQPRFKSIATARGWTSAKDLIGYYNPLANEYQASRTGLYDVLMTLQREQESKVDVPYWVLLDEANLSPMEHYWSDFMKLCDADSERVIPLVKGRQIDYMKIGHGLRFVATINYDHTTEVFSPRLIDRVAVIRLTPPEELSITWEDNVPDLPEPEDYTTVEQLHHMFNPDSVGQQLKGDVASLFQRIKGLLESDDPALGQPILISPRKQQAIAKYCVTARQVFIEQEDQLGPLDYAVNQYVLPLIAGRGKGFHKRLRNLQDAVKYMPRTSNTLGRIIKIGEENFDNYRFFV